GPPVLSRKLEEKREHCWRGGQARGEGISLMMHGRKGCCGGVCLRFFEALSTLEPGRSPEEQASLDEIRLLASAPARIREKELQADEYGIIYASMAGFAPQAIVTDDYGVNFFLEWIQLLDPQRLHRQTAPTTHPSPTERAKAVRSRLKEVLAQVAVFDLGLQWYQAGAYVAALRAFEHFVRAYPSREAYHNLATTHHQLALQAHRTWKDTPLALPFQLVLTLDPLTRAAFGPRKGASAPAYAFETHLMHALQYYERALMLDPAYRPAALNLGGALLLAEQPYKAVAILEEARKRDGTSWEVHNNLAVALWYAEQPEKAYTMLTQAHSMEPVALTPLFNLGQLTFQSGQPETAAEFWQQYLRHDADSPWATAIRQALQHAEPLGAPPSTVLAGRETLLGVTVGQLRHTLPPALTAPSATQSLVLEPYRFTLAHDDRLGVQSVSDEETIVFLATRTGYTGTSARGIRVGSPVAEVLQAYQRPSRTVPLLQGTSLIYDEAGIAFHTQAGKVVSWLLF
ncbi:MAG: hypothetical protein AB7N91_33185, partial [Candidatus Tectimicrobiota bacterium]